MRVTTSNESILERIATVLLFDHQASLFCITHIVAIYGAVCIFAGLAWLPELLKVALLVIRAQTRRAFGISLDLENFGEGFSFRSAREPLGRERASIAVLGI